MFNIGSGIRVYYKKELDPDFKKTMDDYEEFFD